MSLLLQTLIFLGTAIITVPIAKRLGLGAVLGYLIGGIIIGPFALSLIGHVDSILHFAEFGIVLLLFIIGLELQPSRLWTMRKSVFGMGGLQVAATGAILTALAVMAGLALPAAIIVGFTLALSSTAFALQILAEKGMLTTRPGRAAFSVLLFQDLAVVPLLALVQLLSGDHSDPADIINLGAFLKAIAFFAGVLIAGHYLLRPLLRLVALTGIREIFSAVALFLVTGTALLAEVSGLSMALGAFVAGVLLADSEYRHELEADIEPFKGLLLGLFFIAVGMSVNLGLAFSEPMTVFAIVLGLITVKGIVLYIVGRLFGLDNASARSLALTIAQGGEFAFVILGAAVASGAVDTAISDQIILAVTLSMGITPLLIAIDGWLGKGRPGLADKREFETPKDEENQVIIAGFGRVGQIIGRVLRAKNIGFTAIEKNPSQVDFVRKFGNKIYYGDPSRIGLLRAAKAHKARIFVLAVDDVDSSLEAVRIIHKHFPNLTIHARARNRMHAHQLMELGVKHVQRETFLSSLEMSRQVLSGLGYVTSEAAEIVETFRLQDEERLSAQQGIYRDEDKMAAEAREWALELERIMKEDEAAKKGHSE